MKHNKNETTISNTMKFDDTSRLFPWLKLVGNMWVDTRNGYPLAATAKWKAKKMCRQCRRVEVDGIKRFCGKCARARKLAVNRVLARQRRLNVGKPAPAAC